MTGRMPGQFVLGAPWMPDGFAFDDILTEKDDSSPGAARASQTEGTKASLSGLSLPFDKSVDVSGSSDFGYRQIRSSSPSPMVLSGSIQSLRASIQESSFGTRPLAMTAMNRVTTQVLGLPPTGSPTSAPAPSKLDDSFESIDLEQEHGGDIAFQLGIPS